MGRREPGRGRTELTAPARRVAAAGARHWAEELAERVLAAKGYQTLARNYRSRGGEIDLVCRAPDGTVVFVEVRQRRSTAHGGAGESLTAAKLGRVRRAAARFLAVELGRSDSAARFDAVLVAGEGPRAVVTHLEDAF